MFNDLHLAYYETSAWGGGKQKFALELKKRGFLLVKWETPVKRLTKRSKAVKKEKKGNGDA